MADVGANMEVEVSEGEGVNMSQLKDEVVNLEREVEVLHLKKRKEELLQERQELEQVARTQ